MRRVASASEVRWLTDLLAETGRPPVVVASVPADAKEPPVDLDLLDRELAGAVELVVVEHAATYRLSDALGSPSLSVHSGWARLYPADQSWRRDPTLAPRFRPIPGDPRRATTSIVEAALEHLYRTGARPATAVVASGAARRAATATVTGILNATQAVVTTTDRRQAVVHTLRLLPGIAADRLFARGQELTGELVGRAAIADFVPNPPPEPSSRVLELAGDGIITSARVSSVGASRVQVQLLPGFDLAVHGTPGDDMTRQAAVGEIVTVEVVPVDGELVAAFSDGEPSPALSIYPGGPPWLSPEEGAGTGSPAATAPATLETPPVHGAEAPAGAVSEWTALEEEVERLEAELAAERRTSASLRRELRRARRATAPRVYSDDERQLRFELFFVYLCQVVEGDRNRYPWPEQYRIGPDFVPSMEALLGSGGISRDRIVEVAVDILCGRAKDNPSRALKQWRSSRTGPALTRSDGAVAMRARLQTGTASARRLRYWKLPNGEIELDAVMVHDEGL